MTELKLKRGTFQHVEDELYYYHETKKEILRLKLELMHGKGSDDENVGGGRSSTISNPTERTGILLATHKKLSKLEEITDAIDSIYERIHPDKQKLVRVRYWTRPQVLNWEGIAREVKVNRATAIRWRNEIVQAVAIKLGWA